ncbi:MAG TPA: FAD-dependent oxidoreductase, partial [bacterium]|nr:FAD-dependent oxidoreductase [bacterium]
VERWAGLRPCSADRLPLLGETRLTNLIVATGHFRNGILLMPITAKLIADMIITGKSSPMLAPFSPSRFNGSTNA